MSEPLQVVMTCLPVWLACLCYLIACSVTSVACYCHWLHSKVSQLVGFYENNDLHSRESSKWMPCGILLKKNGYIWWFWTLSGARWFSWSLGLVYLDILDSWVLWFTCACTFARFTSTGLASLLPASLGLYQVMTNPYGASPPHQVCVWACLWWIWSWDQSRYDLYLVPAPRWLLCVDAVLLDCWFDQQPFTS